MPSALRKSSLADLQQVLLLIEELRSVQPHKNDGGNRLAQNDP